MQLKKYELNVADKDIESQANEDVATFEGNNVYQIYPLDFGGYLAIEPDQIHCYKRRVKTKVVSKKLRKHMKIKAISRIDKYNSETKLTTEGNNIMRYIFATDNGELYMLAFCLDYISLVHSIGMVNQ